MRFNWDDKNKLRPLRYWAYKILPLVYDDSLSYYEVLCRVVAKVNETTDFINNYYDNYGITVADPIEWDITTQYPKWTIVLDDNGTAYISTQDVPKGIPLSNGDYWTSIFNFGEVIEQIKDYAFPRPNSNMYVIGFRNTVEDVSEHEGNSFNIIHTRTDKVIMYDLGWKYSRAICQNIFNLYGITKCDVLILSHFHNDHVGNLENVLSLLDCSEMVAYLPAQPSAQWIDGNILARYNECVTLLRTNGIPIVTISDTTVQVDRDTQITFYNSNNDAYFLDNFGTGGNNYNNTSRCARVRTDGNDVLFLGDLEIEGFKKFREQAVHGDLVQMPHHGYGREYSTETFELIQPLAMFVNNARSIAEPDSDDLIPRIWNNIYIQAQKNGVPVFATSENINLDLVFNLGAGIACDTRNCKIYNFKYGRGLYESVAEQTRLAGGSLSTLTTKEIIDEMETGSKSNGINTTANNIVPFNGVSYQITKSNTGFYEGSYGDGSTTVIDFMGNGNGRIGRIMHYYNPDTQRDYHHLQNLGVGNFYRLRFNDIAAGGGSPTENRLTAKHGNDCSIADGVITFDSDPGIKAMLLTCEIQFSAAPAAGDSLTFKIGTEEITIQVPTNARRHYISIIFIASSSGFLAGEATVINNTTGAISAAFINAMPIYYTGTSSF